MKKLKTIFTNLKNETSENEYYDVSIFEPFKMIFYLFVAKVSGVICCLSKNKLNFYNSLNNNFKHKMEFVNVLKEIELNKHVQQVVLNNS